MKFLFRSLIVVLFLMISIIGFSQTTYTWVGGNGSWATAANWSPAIVPPNSNLSIVEFSDGGTYEVTAVPTQIIRQLLVTNGTNVTLRSSGTTTLTLTPGTGNIGLQVASGSTLSNTATNILSITTTNSTQIIDISGTLTWLGGTLTATGNTLNVSGTVNFSTGTYTATASAGTGSTISGVWNMNSGTASLFNSTISGTVNVLGGTLNMNSTAVYLVTFTGSGIINHTAGTINGSVAGLLFDSGSNYNYLGTGVLTIPTATWDTNSNVNITGITAATTIGGTAQSFGNCTYNCASQGNVAVTFAATSATRFKGDFNLQSTGAGTGSVSFKSGTTAVILNVDGVYNQTGGVLNANIAATAGLTLNLNGGYSQTAASTFNLSTATIACILNIGGNFNQSAGTFTQTSATTSTVNFNGVGSRTYSASGTITNTNLNYVVVSPAELTLNATLTTAASRTFTINSGATLILGSGNLASAAATGGLITNSGTLILSPTSIISGSGGFTNTSAAATTISIGSQQGITATGGGTSGNIHVAGTRTYGAAANYIYTGTNGQVTGNGCPASVTGNITVNLQNFSDQLTLTNVAAIGAAGTLRMVRGQLANAITYNATGRLEYASTTGAQTTSNNEFPATTGPAGLIINNTDGVTLHAARSLPATASGVLTLTSGTINTSTTNVLTVSNATVGAIVGGGATTYVNGPLIRAINAAGQYTFPVGDGSVYGGYSMLTTAAASGVSLRTQFVNSASGGTAGAGLAALNNYHWLVERTAGTTSVTYTPTFTVSGLVTDSRVGYSKTLTGAYDNVGGLGIGATVTAAQAQTISTTDPNAYYTTGTSSTLSGTITSYTTLTSIAAALQTMIVTGNTIFELPTSYSGEPAYPVVFTEFAEDGTGPYNVIIRPASGSTNFLTAGDPGTGNALINFNGIDRITIDGRAGGTGSSIWTFRNTRTAATVGPTFQFINDATFNTLTYLNVEGQNITTSSGTIFFSTSVGLTLGNSNNTISYCDIRDRSDVTGLPANAIISSGTASIPNTNNQVLNNNIFNFYLSAGVSVGVNILANNTAWTVEGNSFYQTASRVNNGASSTAINVLNSGIDFIIRDNYIGGTEPLCAGTPYTFTGTGAGTFAGVIFNPATAATGCELENNTIRNISWSRGTSGSSFAFIGIRNTNGNTLIKSNTIGATTGTGSIILTEAFATGVNISYGIYIDAGTTTVEDNTIGAITLAGSTAGVAHGFCGIRLELGLHTIENNTIGSETTANSINASNASISITGQPVVGIQYNSTTPGNHSLLGNKIANLNNAAISAGGSMRGISTSPGTTGSFTITGNQIYNLVVSTANTGTGTSASNIGILMQRTTVGLTISENTIHSLSNIVASSAVHISGIHISGPATGTNIVSGNNIHSLSLVSSNTACSIIGINALSGFTTYSNNMIRLGIDATGTSIATAYNIQGISFASATANNNFYHNSVYIGGTGVTAGTNNTYAFYRSANGSAINILNNIFVNARSNGAGTGRHVSIGFSAAQSAANLNSNNNLYNAAGTGGAIGWIGTTPYDNIVAWQTAVTPDDNNSIAGAAGFINPTGTAALVDLHINPATPTQAESGGVVISGLDTDYDGDIRQGSGGYAGTGTAPDIGADEGEFIPTDATPPFIVYTVIPTQTSFTAPTLSSTITDANAVDVSTGFAPRIYFKRSTDLNEYNDNTSGTAGWKYVESTTGTSPFALPLNYALLSGGTGVSAGNTIQYFVVAQDVSANVAINSGTFAAAPSNVQLTAAAFPIGGTINSFYINVLNGTYTVGTGGDFLSLTNPGGLFETINTGSLSGNVIAEITTDLTAELGTYGLNQWIEILGSGYTLTIRPSAAATRIISGNQNIEMFRLNGADRVTIDGSFGGSGQYLIFANASTGTASATFSFLNEATDNTIRYAFLRGSSTAPTKGVVLFGTSSAAGSVGNSNNTIEYCDIHQNASALPTNGIYSAGTAAKLNVNNTISNNNIYNFFNPAGGSSGISLVGNTSAWTIGNNKFYQEATRTTTTGSTFHYVVNINNTSNANTIIRGNYIGGSSSAGTGTMTYTAAVGNQMAAIYLNTNGTTANAVIVENNTITNLSFTTISGATTGIGPFTAIYQLAGASRIIGNTIGGTTGNDAITVTVNENALGVTNGIRYDGTSTAKIENNNIGSFTVAGGTGTNNGQTLYAVNVSTGNVAIKNNSIGSSTTANSIRINSPSTIITSNASALGGINIVSTASYTDSVLLNRIYNLTNFNAGTATRIFGVSATSGGQYFIEDNTVRNLSLIASTNVGTTSTPAALGIALVTSNNQLLSVSRNVIHSLSNAGSGVSAWTTGIHYSGGTNAANVIEGNLIHSLSPSSGAAANVCGIQLAGGTTTNVRNNMVRLGIDAAGASITQAHNLFGIQQTVNNIHNIYHNSVYVGGTGVGGVLPTFAYQRVNATLNTATALRNNIFVNNRSNGAGSGTHYAINITVTLTASLTSDHNVFHTNGTGGAVGLVGATSYSTLTAWKTGTSRDASSLYGNPEFVNAIGNATNVDLHINPVVATPAESNGFDVGVLVDYDNDVRSGLTPTDIGADAGNFLPLDLVAPIITYTNLTGVCNTATTHSLSGVIITDALSNINFTAGTKPRLYYKKSTTANDISGWQYVEATGAISPFGFNIDLTTLGSLSAGENIQYFVVAQDEGPIVYTPNVAINSGAFAVSPTSVALTSAAFPIAGSLNSFVILPCSGTVTVGAGGSYPSLTNDGGLFQALNDATLSGNVTATVISDLTNELGTHGLNQWSESGIGGYRVTLTPDATTLRTISGTYAGTNAATAGLYRINGADRFVVDGRNPADLSAGGRYLLFRNASTTAVAFNSTFNFLNDATNDTLRYIIVEGATLGATNGVIRFSDGMSTGNDNIAMDNCHIRDRSDAAGLPLNGIYATSIAGAITNNVAITNNEIFNFWGAAAVSSSGIFITSGNTDWTISGNSLYQTASRAGGGTVIHYGIQVDNSTNGNNFTIENNYVGGGAALTAGTAWTITGTSQVGFIGISSNIMTSAISMVQGNTVANFNISTSRTSTFPTNNFNGILAVGNGQTTINNNTVGSTIGTGSIILNMTGVNGVATGIGHSTSTGDVIITNNNIGSFTFTGSPSEFNAIRYAQGGSSSTRTISGNLIGSTSTTNSIYMNIASAVSGDQHVFGINMTSGANAVSVTNNTIANLNNNRPNTGAGQVIGINSGFASNTITGNTIYNLTTNSNNTGTGASAVVIGISLVATAANDQLISQNTIYGLSGTGSNPVSLIGIYYSSATGTTNRISRNLIHGIRSSSTAAADIAGIYLGTCGVTVSNNMIRLGLDNTGASISNPSMFQGIVKNNTSINNAIYYNSVYIGGSGVGTTATPTYAFRKLGFNSADNVRNNIFVNARSNSSSGGKHYGVHLNVATAFAMSNNLIFTPGIGGVFGGINTTDYANLSAWNVTGFGANSVSADPNFIAPVAATPDLNLVVGSANPAESGGVVIAGLEDDFGATGVRTGYPQVATYGGGTAPDMGADETDMTPIDVTAPLITNMTVVPTVSIACGTTAAVNISATITDPSGVATGGLLPRLWWRLSTGTYAAVAPISVVGNVYNYELNLTGLLAGQIFHYYIAAQDIVGNIGYSHSGSGTPVHSDVATYPTTINTAPATFSVSSNVPLSGTVTVGSGGTYPRFNGTGGLFEAINNNGLSGNLIAEVITDISESAFWTPLNAHAEYCGTDFTITIKPVDDASVYTIEANTSAANAMFSFYGARRVVIDGSYNGSGRYLRLRHNRITTIFPSTVEYNNGANNNVLRNCIIEGANTNLSSNTTGSVGVVRIGGSMGFASGTLNNITISGNEIRNLSNVASTLANTPMILLYMGGASIGATISDITITGNDFYNFQQSAILADNGSSGSTNSIGNNITVTNNNIYQILTIPTYQYPIIIDGLGNTTGHLISGNKIGGSSSPSPNITGTWTNNKSDGEVQAIYLNVGNAVSQDAATTVSNNAISNISLSGTGWGNFIGIRVERGRVNVTGNTIGSLASSLTSPNITMAGNGGAGLTDNSMMSGIWTQSTEEVVVDNNIVCGLSNTAGFSFFDGIAHGSNLYLNGFLYNTPGGKVTMTNNQVLFNRSASALQNLAIPSPEGFMGIFCWTNQQDNIISNNKIRNCGSGTSIWNRNVRIHGMFVGVYGSTTAQTGIVSNNEISHLFNENAGDNTGTINPIVYGLTIANGNWTVANNTIYLNNGTQGGTLITNRNTSLRGLNDGMLFNQANCQARYYNNTVYISGSNLTGSGPANSTYAFLRFPLDFGSLSITAGAPLELRNNLFVNDRGGQGNHRAIGNIANNNSNAAINWNSNSSNYNLFSASNANNVALWGSSTTYTLANWRTFSSSDQSTLVATAASPSSTTQFSPSDLFVNGTGTGVANLRINSSNQACWFVNGKGVAGSQVNSLAEDFEGNARETTYGYGIDIGADEFTPDASVLPHDVIATPVLNGTNTFSFAGRTFGAISWANVGTVPTSITGRWFTGENPGTFNSPAYGNTDFADFMVEFVPTGGSGYQYTPTIYYDDALLGTYASTESAMPLIKTVATNWLQPTATVINTTSNTLAPSTAYTSFSHFGGGTSFSNPLPVELLSFTATPINNEYIKLDWITVLEINNDGFFLQRSTDAQNWSNIAWIEGNDNSTATHVYSHNDDQVDENVTYYYRLKQVDNDGKFEYSKIVSAMLNGVGEGFEVLNLMPNPTTDQTKLLISSSVNQEITVSIYTPMGQLVQRIAYSLDLGVNQLSLDVNTLAAGNYLVTVTNADQVRTKRLIITQ
jgi:hypothetical protein